jgi:flagellar hook-associated protein 3 FlgL
MRISTSLLQQLGTNSILDNQARLSKTQQQLSTGRRILSPSDDPVGATRVLDLNQSIDSLQQYTANSTAAQSRLQLEESVLQSSGDLLTRINELAVQANNATTSNETRSGIASEAEQLLGELVAYANTKDGNGDYLFAGFQVAATPYSQTGTNVSYNGDQGQRFLEIGPGRQIAVGDPGADVFNRVKNGNGTFVTAASTANSGSGIIDIGQVVDPGQWVPDNYTITFLANDAYEVRDGGGAVVSSGAPQAGDSFTVQSSTSQDIFSTLRNFIDALKTPVSGASSQAQLHSRLGSVLGDVDQALSHVLEYRTIVGSRLKAIDDQQAINDSLTLNLQQNKGAIEDLDYADATARLNMQLVALQAAQQTFTRLQNLTLFNYL